MHRVTNSSGLARMGISLALILSAASLTSAVVRAGDSLYAAVTEVQDGTHVTLDYGTGVYIVRIAGIVSPDDPTAEREAVDFVSKLLLGKNARLHLDEQEEEGDQVPTDEPQPEPDALAGRLFTDDPVIGIQDVGLEMVRAGLAFADPKYEGYPYGDMVTAEFQAREAQRGIWAPNR